MPRSTSKKPLVLPDHSKSIVAEAYRGLRTNVDFSSFDEKVQAIAVTSTSPEEGKSTTLANLALSYANAEQKVLVIDADMRQPSCHKIFNVANRFGLSSVLSGQAEVMSVIRETSNENLFVIPSGPIPPNPSELLGSRRLDAMMELLKDKFDIIIMDTPAVLAVTDPVLVASRCDGVLFVVQAGKVKRERIVKAKAILEHSRARILGVVLNNVKLKKKELYYQYGEKM